jgi:L-rhamnose mutarotase
MRIYRTGNRLVMLMEVDDKFDAVAKAAADAADPAVCAWEELMSNFQQNLPWAAAGEKWVEARQIFDLRDQQE